MYKRGWKFLFQTMMFSYNSLESMCVINPSSTYVTDGLKCPLQTWKPHLLYLEEFSIWSSTSLNCPEHNSPWKSVKLQPIKHCAVASHGIRILFYFVFVSVAHLHMTIFFWIHVTFQRNLVSHSYWHSIFWKQDWRTL